MSTESAEVPQEPIKPDVSSEAKRLRRLRSATGIPAPNGYRVFRALVMLVGRCLLKGQMYGLENLPQPRANYRPAWYRRSSDARISHFGYVLAPNHTDERDIPMTAWRIKRPMTWLCKPWFVKHPLAAAINQRVGAVPVMRKKDLDRPAYRAVAYEPREALEVVSQAVIRGIPAVIYPQGERRPDGRIDDSFLGAAIVAFNANRPIVPVGIYGTGKTDDVRKTRILHRRYAVAVIGHPIYPDDFAPVSPSEERAAQQAMMQYWQSEVASLREQARACLLKHHA